MSGDDLFRRWTDRKRRVARQEADEARAEAEQARQPEEDAPDPGEPETEDEILARLELPDPDTLQPGDDFKAFMAAGVPEAIRRRALRRLWRSNPVLANLDGLNDYDVDYTAPDMTQKVLATAYKVGRGILRDRSEDDPVKPDETPQAPADVPQEASADPEPVEDTAAPVETGPLAAAREPVPEEPPLRPRRMTFHG